MDNAVREALAVGVEGLSYSAFERAMLRSQMSEALVTRAHSSRKPTVAFGPGPFHPRHALLEWEPNFMHVKLTM